MQNKLSQTLMSQRPSVKRYSDIYKFVQDEFNYRKSIDNKFTLDMWSYQLGFKSRSFVFMVYNNQRQMTLNFVQSLASSLNLSDAEQDHLFLIFDYAKTKKSSQKKIYLNQILENLETNEKYIDLQHHMHFLSSQNLLLIKLLLAFDDIEGTEKELARRIGCKIGEIRKSLKDLQDMNLVFPVQTEARSEIVWKTKEKAFIISHDVQQEAVQLFHQNTIDEAKLVLNQKELTQKFQSIFFALQKEKFPELIMEMETFLTKMKNKYGCDQIEDKDLIKLNLQAYPVVKAVSKY